MLFVQTVVGKAKMIAHIDAEGGKQTGMNVCARIVMVFTGCEKLARLKW